MLLFNISKPDNYKVNKNPSQDSSVGSILAGIGEVPGSNRGKGENFSIKISSAHKSERQV